MALTCHHIQVVIIEGRRSASHPQSGAAAKHRPKQRVGLIEAGCILKTHTSALLLSQHCSTAIDIPSDELISSSHPSSS